MTPDIIDVPAVRLAIGIAAAAKGARPVVVLVAERVAVEPEVWRVDLAVERKLSSGVALVAIQAIGRYAGSQGSAHEAAESDVLKWGLEFDGHLLAGDQ